MIGILAALWLSTGNAIRNGDFEAKAAKGVVLPEWDVSVGATNGATEPQSILKLDVKEKHGGKASLCLSGDGTTRAWKIAQQDVPARPGGTYRLAFQAKTEKVRQETIQGTDIRQ